MDLHKNYNSSLCLLHRLYDQNKDGKNKVYSLHASEVESISKGKTHETYEFGCKPSYVASSQDNFVLGALVKHGNPFDGHTLPSDRPYGSAIRIAYRTGRKVFTQFIKRKRSFCG